MESLTTLFRGLGRGWDGCLCGKPVEPQGGGGLPDRLCPAFCFVISSSAVRLRSSAPLFSTTYASIARTIVDLGVGLGVSWSEFKDLLSPQEKSSL